MTEKTDKLRSTQPIFGVPIFIGSKNEALDILTSQTHGKGETMLIFTPNPEQLTLALHDPGFKRLLQAADLNLPDGQGLVWALSRAGAKGVKRIPGREVFHDLLSKSREHKWKVFLLGGRPGSARILADKYQCGFDPGAVDIKRETPEEKTRVLEAIKKFKPELLFVAYGAPRQEEWLSANREALSRIGVKVAMVVGGAFDYEAGLVRRVPGWIESAHLEWLWRLITEPWRAGRQLKGLEFFWRVLSS